MAYKMVPSSLRISAVLIGGHAVSKLLRSQMKISEAAVQQGYKGEKKKLIAGLTGQMKEPYTNDRIEKVVVPFTNMLDDSHNSTSSSRALFVSHRIVLNESLV